MVLKLYYLSFMLALQMPIHAQALDKGKFIFYEDVINELKSTKNILGLAAKYDYLFIQLLDSTEIELIKKSKYPDVEIYRDYAAGLALSNQMVGFDTDKKQITEIFKDDNSLKRIISCTNSHNSPDIPSIQFDYPVYIKGNTAVFQTFGPTWSDLYFARLEKGKFLINWLGGTME